MWENKLTIDDLNEIFDKLNKMFEEKEKFRTYPIVIFGLKEDTISKCMEMFQEAYEKYELNLIKINTTEQLDYHLKCNTYYRTSILFTPDTEEFKNIVASDLELYNKGKIFNAFYDTLNNKIRLIQLNGN